MHLGPVSWLLAVRLTPTLDFMSEPAAPLPSEDREGDLAESLAHVGRLSAAAKDRMARPTPLYDEDWVPTQEDIELGRQLIAQESDKH